MTQTTPSLQELAETVSEHLAMKLQAQLIQVTPEYLTPPQAAKLTGFSLRALEAMRAKRSGPAYVKLGAAKNGPIRYRLADIHAWMQSHREVTDGGR